MTDKEILEEVYRLMTKSNVPLPNIQSFIEQEWQRQDEIEYDGWLSDVGQPLPKRSDAVLNMDYSECQHKPNNNTKDERHRELEIDEDGTIKKLK